MRRRAPLLLLVPALALGTAACGSSHPVSTAVRAAATTPSSARRAQLAACLKRQGVKLPARPDRPPGARGRGGGPGFFFGGGSANARRRSPFGNPKLRAALQKCGFRPGQGGRRFGANSTRFRKALTKFVACVRRHGYKLPKPNTSGRGPVFDPSKVNRKDPKFISATRRCASVLRPQRHAG